MMKLNNMSRDQRNLLLYFESCSVDYTGKLQSLRMNSIDFAIAKQWDNDGFIFFGRVLSSDISNDRNYWCLLTDGAWTLAHEERKARAHRMFKKRKWVSTGEGRGKGNPELKKDQSKIAGGLARAASLTPERRSEIARHAANARWGK